jgi:hypothetical protein
MVRKTVDLLHREDSATERSQEGAPALGA